MTTPEPPDLHDSDWRMDFELNRYMFEAYCLTIVTDLSIDEFLALVPSARVVDECDYETLEDRGMDIFSEIGGGAGLLQVGSSVVMFEPNGYRGVTTDLMIAVSIGRTVVSDLGSRRTSASTSRFRPRSAPRQRIRAEHRADSRARRGNAQPPRIHEIGAGS
ncbi:DUF6461 domain-containing protein [Williamsia serinedens]|uniref:Uncharacterized protein n=1 Tax=Williamsia serinedens TaxID=391736 RepID=A0ABT1H7Z4_9NOCA|nr:DUF6461 domain-containing protein [Williamsia serinedens]MCP2162022.1 hypothetical protein [Williamsia serinedens]